ncbi:MAG: universal stress protein [Acidimicrobiia bacterium]|nr:universal stress protein [Acidimicrobiia bacterium]
MTKPLSTVESHEAATDLDEHVGMVVGIDSSPGSAHAVAWAARRTDRFGPVRPVAAWRYPTWAVSDPMLGAPPPAPVEDFAEVARRDAEKAVAEVPEAERSPLVLVRSPAGPALVDVGADANLIVVGTRGRGAVADSLLGSVSCYVVNHATVPVAVVPRDVPLDDVRNRVIVGIDGSANSVTALRWALQHSPKDMVVEAVHAWSQRAVTIPEPYTVPIEYSEQDAAVTVERTVVQAMSRLEGPERDVVRTLHYGDPRNVLRERSPDADLLVLGARGHRGVAHLLLGSVTTGLIHQPLVATIVVPVGDD